MAMNNFRKEVQNHRAREEEENKIISNALGGTELTERKVLNVGLIGDSGTSKWPAELFPYIYMAN